jgi:hypothetical protein
MDIKAARLDQQLQRLDLPSQILGRKEIRELPQILWDDEEALDVIQGTYNNGNGILVATQKRLVFVDKGIFYGLKVEDFPLDKISSIQYETGMLLGSITIFTSGNKAIIKNVDKTRARTFAEGVRARTATKPPAPQVAPPAPRATHDLTGELEKLGNLRERGLLSDEEFTAAKRKLLGV